MSGYSRTASRWSDVSPKMTSSRLMTVAKTGRRTETSAIRIASGRVAADFFDRRAVPHVLRAFDDHALPFREARDDLDVARPALADANLAPLDDAIVDDEHVGPALLGPENGRASCRGYGAE